MFMYHMICTGYGILKSCNVCSCQLKQYNVCSRAPHADMRPSQQHTPGPIQTVTQHTRSPPQKHQLQLRATAASGCKECKTPTVNTILVNTIVVKTLIIGWSNAAQPHPLAPPPVGALQGESAWLARYCQRREQASPAETKGAP